MIYILYDKPKSMEDMSFIPSKIAKEYIEIYPDIRCDSIKKVFSFSRNTFKRFSKGDVVICWYDFMGVILYFLSRIHNKPLNVLSLNILLKDKHTFKNWFAKYLYKKALLNLRFYATVSTEEYGNKINSILGIKKEFYHLHDPYHKSYKYDKNVPEEDYIFCGGRNGRDWNLMIDIANTLTNENFCFVMAETDFEQYKTLIPENVEVKTNIPYEDFMSKLCGASIVTLPLTTWAPAGLTVLFQAVANEKLVLTTSTVSTDEYLRSTPDLLCNSKDEWIQKIDFYMNSEYQRKSLMKQLKRDIEQKCSEDKYSLIISKIVNDIEENKLNG